MAAVKQKNQRAFLCVLKKRRGFRFVFYGAEAPKCGQEAKKDARGGLYAGRKLKVVFSLLQAMKSQNSTLCRPLAKCSTMWQMHCRQAAGAGEAGVD